MRQITQNVFLSPPSARRATGSRWGTSAVQTISIPALREEGDTSHRPKQLIFNTISIPALREEGDRWAVIEMVASYDFYPRPPRGGRRALARKAALDMRFLSPPSARRATTTRPLRSTLVSFLSPPSARRATLFLQIILRLFRISIPALREEGDISSINYPEGTANFYPRPPRGGRLTSNLLTTMPALFLSPPSARRATKGIKTSKGAA